MNIFILFAPGLGGNHLANILSLDSRFRSRANDEVYASAAVTAHVKLQNINCQSIEKHLDQLVNQNNVFCGHWMEYVELKKSKLIEHFPNRIFCVIQMPKSNDRFYHRLLSKNPDATPWLLHEVALLYRTKNIKKLIDEKESSFVDIHPHMLCNQDITVLLDDVKNQGFDIKVDIEKAQRWHNVWIDKNFKNKLD